jgi:hypothetical protein
MVINLRDEIYWREVARALLVMGPIFICFLFFHELPFLPIGLITMSLFITASTLKLGLLGVTLHYCLILLSFTLFVVLILSPPLFICLCALFAFLGVYITQYGVKLRTLITFTFIPALYLACELHEDYHGHELLLQSLDIMQLSPLAWLGMVLVNNKTATIDRGEPLTEWQQPAFAIFMGVFISSSLVMFDYLPPGQWVIWSSASVIMTDIATSKKKLHDRIVGAAIGVPIGLALVHILPKTGLTYYLAILGVMVSLVSFKRYILSFMSRSCFVAIATSVIHSSDSIALMRIENVFLGGLIGIFSLYLSYVLLEHYHKNVNSFKF